MSARRCVGQHETIARRSNSKARRTKKNIPGGKVAAIGCNRHGITVNAALVLKGVLAATRAHVPDVHFRVIYEEGSKGHGNGETCLPRTEFGKDRKSANPQRIFFLLLPPELMRRRPSGEKTKFRAIVFIFNSPTQCFVCVRTQKVALSTSSAPRNIACAE